MRNDINICTCAFSLAMLATLSACQADTNTTLESLMNLDSKHQKKEAKYVILNVVAFNYYDRPIHDVYLSGKGAAGAMSAYGGAHGIIAGVQLPLGEQTLTWELGGPKGTPRNGETVTVKNKLVIEISNLRQGVRYLGLHIYPDATAELNFAEDLPEMTERGRELYNARRKNGD